MCRKARFTPPSRRPRGNSVSTSWPMARTSPTGSSCARRASFIFKRWIMSRAAISSPMWRQSSARWMLSSGRSTGDGCRGIYPDPVPDRIGAFRLAPCAARASPRGQGPRMSVRAAITAAALAIAVGGPVHAMDSSGHDTVLNLARENGCILRDADAALTDAGYSDAETRERIILTLVDQRKASRIGDALMVRGAACQQGPKPGLRDRFLAGFGTNADCALAAADLDRTMLRYALTSQDVALLRAEMEGGKDLIASADGTELRLKPAHCE